MTSKEKPAIPADEDHAEAPSSVTELLAALSDSVTAFNDAQGKLLARASEEAEKAGEEFAKLSLRPDSGEFEKLKAHADDLELQLSTAKLQLTEVGTELETAASGLRESHEVRDRLERDLAEARTTITQLQETAAADKELIRSMRTRTEALSATFEAARNALSLPDLDGLPDLAAAASEAPAEQAPAAPAAEAPVPDTEEAPVPVYDFTDPAPDVQVFEDPTPAAEFPDPAPADEEDDPFKPVRSIGTFRPASLPDAGFNPPAPTEEAAHAAPADTVEEEAAAQPGQDEAAAQSGLDLPDLEPAEAAGGLELPDLELGDLELPGAETPAPGGLDLPGLDDLALPGHSETPAPSPFGLLDIPDLEPEPAR